MILDTDLRTRALNTQYQRGLKTQTSEGQASMVGELMIVLKMAHPSMYRGRVLGSDVRMKHNNGRAVVVHRINPFHSVPTTSKLASVP